MGTRVDTLVRALFWLGMTHPTRWRAEPYATLTLISTFVAAIAIRTLIALQRGQLLPDPVAAPRAVPESHPAEPIASP